MDYNERGPVPQNQISIIFGQEQGCQRNRECWLVNSTQNKFCPNCALGILQQAHGRDKTQYLTDHTLNWRIMKGFLSIFENAILSQLLWTNLSPRSVVRVMMSNCDINFKVEDQRNAKYVYMIKQAFKSSLRNICQTNNFGLFNACIHAYMESLSWSLTATDSKKHFTMALTLDLLHELIALIDAQSTEWKTNFCLASHTLLLQEDVYMAAQVLMQSLQNKSRNEGNRG